jgi:hypothetical protein
MMSAGPIRSRKSRGTALALLALALASCGGPAALRGGRTHSPAGREVGPPATSILDVTAEHCTYTDVDHHCGPARGVELRLMRAESIVVAGGTDSLGHARFEGIAPGRYLLVANERMGTPEVLQDSLEIVAGEVLPRHFRFRSDMPMVRAPYR